jgi:uncharacterized membrane protein
LSPGGRRAPAPGDDAQSRRSVIDRDEPSGGPVGGRSLGGPDLPGEVTALAHFYRGELQRSNTWRIRLDATTNWAIITTGGLLTFGFNTPARFALVLVLASIIVLFFLVIEARRYRFYDVWRSRVRLLEVNFVLPFLSDRVCDPRPGWREELARDLLVPRFKISFLEAFGRRLRRNYVWIFLLLVFAWLADLAIHAEAGYSPAEFVGRSGIGWVPGWAVLSLQAVYFAALALIALATAGRRRASGQVLEMGETESCEVVDSNHF